MVAMARYKPFSLRDGRPEDHAHGRGHQAGRRQGQVEGQVEAHRQDAGRVRAHAHESPVPQGNLAGESGQQISVRGPQ